MTINIDLHVIGFILTVVAWFMVRFKLDQLPVGGTNIFDQIVMDAEQDFFSLKNFIQTAIITQLIIFLI